MAIDEEASIPVIDHSAFVLGDECARVKALAEIDRACRDWGFFQLVNHGLGADRLENILQCTRDFFALPLERKLDLVTPMSPIGFLNQSGASGVVDRKEHLLFFGLDHPSVRHNAWPESPHGFRGVVEEMMRECAAFSKLLTRILFEALGLSGDCAREIYNKESGDSFLLPFYPACPPDYEHELVLGQHKDGGILTLLSQLNEVPGLQVLKDDRWITVKPLKNSLVINVGDVMQVWTNGRYKSVMHRVVRRENDRFSMAFFHIPGSSTEIAPLEEFTAHEPPKYRKFVQGEYIQLRMKNRSMGNKAKEVTIEHYAV
ncbi:2-oxoacid-dependent dioxygenase [Selaginella moellendorffii]|uniref:2-oxoacid-dependent dioxygenase n=1 Tax=Selaginella moellendorffii TaxID=88036 RepID=D8R9S0_SELML|nr:probable 2-oxoglutarate-dependent dioxygenase At5g05600 isoform X1 [Selaginella moellendorffii]EFJ30943.1 2-oxoacid-dependent dioxygenase [Selaginella moellendorffii]|eukprot:XP_002967596.1 probable 2-oxoglutarate-dependent dioxygenase At5g05600 isoform X1 [Selaginella moellendorffii]